MITSIVIIIKPPTRTQGKMDMNDKDIFFTQMERIIPLIDSDQSKSEFVKAFFKRELLIDDIENSMISLQRMNSKVFYYLLLALLIDYCNEFETNEKSDQD
jgi:hypothetical protein